MYQDTGFVYPTKDEVMRWLLETVQHSFHVEWYLMKLRVGLQDKERPHDLVGTGSKFDFSVIRGFALQYRDEDTDFFRRNVLPSLENHRRQKHHIMWNYENPNALDDMMRLGAIDTICAFREDRKYQGGVLSWQEIKKRIANAPDHQKKWLIEAYNKMRVMPEPRIDLITDLQHLFNCGISMDMYYKIRRRIRNVVHTLKGKGYDL